MDDTEWHSHRGSYYQQKSVTVSKAPDGICLRYAPGKIFTQCKLLYNVLYGVQPTVRSLMLNLAIILLDCLGWTNRSLASFTWKVGLISQLIINGMSKKYGCMIRKGELHLCITI